MAMMTRMEVQQQTISNERTSVRESHFLIQQNFECFQRSEDCARVINIFLDGVVNVPDPGRYK